MIDELVPIVLFIVFGAIVKIVSDNKVRRLAIEKGMINENIKYLYLDKFEARVPSSLKWGMVLIGIGLALTIGQLLPSRISETVTVGFMFLLAGLALVVYYFIGRRMLKKEAKEGN